MNRRWIPAFAGVTLGVWMALWLCAAARAAPYTYASDGCEFRITLPDEPAITRSCDPKDSTKCAESAGFTHVFGADATVKVTATCNPADTGMYDHYSGDVMRATLSAMVGKDTLDKYQTGFQQFDVAKQAVIMGTGKTGNSVKLYIAQLWIGHKSIFTVEGEVVGGSDDADAMFAAILKSIRHESWPERGGQPVPTVEKAAPQQSQP